MRIIPDAPKNVEPPRRDPSSWSGMGNSAIRHEWADFLP